MPCPTETKKPTMKDLNRYVTKKYANEWQDIGIELGLCLDTLKVIEKDNFYQCGSCLRETLDKWLKLNNCATWNTLEVAITNVRRAALGLDPVSNVYGKVHIY